jgi:carboxymethylenebutenolidase
MENARVSANRVITTIDRRKLMGGIAVLGAASALAAPAMAAIKRDDAGLRTIRARYALRNGTMITGFFAAPKGKTDLDVVLVMPANDAAAEDIARRYAGNGYLAIAPDFAKAQGKAVAGAARDAKVAEVMRAMPGLKRMMNGNGRVVIATA